MPDTACSYRLKLSNGQGWNILSDEHNRAWTERFASILNLSTVTSDEESFMLTFVRNQKDKSEGSPGVHIEVPANLNRKASVFTMWKSILPIYKQAIMAKGVPIHSALIEHDKKGFLLAAPGGTGKTTCCNRLPTDWNAHCDDETLLVWNGEDNSYKGHPFPTWSNFYLDRPPWDWEVERSLQVNGIFFLQQSKVDSIEYLGQGKSAALIYQASSQICRRIWNELDSGQSEELKKHLFTLAGDVARQIPAFILNVSLDGMFWELIADASASAERLRS